MKSPFDILADYKLASEPQIRSNALTALAVEGEDDGVAAIVQAALSDPAEAVRRRAEHELTELETSHAIRAARENLCEALKSDATKRNAYALMGRLRNAGFDISGSGLPWIDRMRLAFSNRRLEYSQTDVHFRLRLKPGLLAGLIGMVLALSVYFLHPGLEELTLDGNSYLLLISGMIGAPLLSVGVSWYTVPTVRQIDRSVAISLEVFLAFAWGMVVGFLSLFILILAEVRLQRDPMVFSEMVWSFVAFGVVIAIIRAGTIATSGLAAGKLSTRLLRIASGTVFGLPALILMPLQPELNILLLVPICPAIANAFARIDEEFARRRDDKSDPVPSRALTDGVSEALAIVEEYLRSSEHTVRIRALSALAAVKGEAGVQRIFRVALEDEETEVRRVAEKLLVQMKDKESSAAVVNALSMALSDPKLRNNAYLLAGRLSSQGFPLRGSGLRPLKRFQMAYSLRSLLYIQRDARFRPRMFKPVLMGSIVGAVFVVAFLFVAHVVNPTPLVVGIPIAIVSGLVVSQFAVPTYAQVDRVAGAIAEFARSFIWSLSAVLILSAIGVGIMLQDSVLAVLFCLPITIPAVRLGTLIGHGVFKEPRANQFAQEVVGFGVGVGTVVLLIAVFFTIGTEVADIVFLALLPACYAVAHTFASIDWTSTPRQPLLGRAAKPLTQFMMLALVTPVLLVITSQVLESRSRTTPGPEVIRSTADVLSITEGDSHLLPVEIPSETRIDVSGEGQSVAIECLNCVPDGTRLNTPPYTLLEIALVDSAGSDREFGPDVQLEAGTYVIDVRAGFVNALMARSFVAMHEGLVLPHLYDHMMLRQTDNSEMQTNTNPVYQVRLRISSTSSTLAEVSSARRYMQQFSWEPDQDGLYTAIDSLSAINMASWALLELDPSIWNNLCWYGSLLGEHKEPVVRASCDYTVTSARYSIFLSSYRDSRGLNLALNGDLSGAIDDFQTFVNDTTKTLEDRNQRQRWIEDLRKGRNPLTEDVLLDLQ